MDIPTDRLLMMLIVATAFAVLGSGWAAGLVHSGTTGWENYLLRIGISIVFLGALVAFWFIFRHADKQRGNVE